MMNLLLASFRVRRVRWVQSVVICSLHAMPKVARISPALNTCNRVHACVLSHRSCSVPSCGQAGWNSYPIHASMSLKSSI